jgi:hypothetical protein
MTSPADAYPHAHAGDPAAPPRPPTVRQLTAAYDELHARLAAAGLPEAPLRAAYSNWRMAASLSQLLAEADAANPARDKTSDGGIANDAHTMPSDHIPWVTDAAGKGVVRARDFDVDGLDVAGAFERARLAAVEGRLPQLIGGGYLIHNRRITAPDFSGWRNYTGPNPHTLHGHVSVSTSAARYDDRSVWGIWTPTVAPSPRPVPAPAPVQGWTGPDLTGRGLALRGDHGNNGPRVGQLQGFLKRYAPAYAGRLVTDGWWGDHTTAILAEFAHRSGIPEADGRNVGPKIAAALYRAGFDRTAATARALAHVRRGAR